ncbi:MAG TPA: hypothetical protein VLF89_10320 [Candidatus Saccharimonadales bacterium]|nr:hypothetical protein [Candidatus Saccharimonadales bacterium]
MTNTGLTDVVNNLAGASITGSTTLLQGNVGTYVVFGLIIGTLLLVAGAVYLFINWKKSAR